MVVRRISAPRTIEHACDQLTTRSQEVSALCMSSLAELNGHYYVSRQISMMEQSERIASNGLPVCMIIIYVLQITHTAAVLLAVNCLGLDE